MSNDVVSACCGAGVEIAGRITHHYVCTRCRKPTDLAKPLRKVHSGLGPIQEKTEFEVLQEAKNAT